MATSGTSAFNLTTATLIDEAFERCGVDPATLDAGKIRGALRSLDLLFREWDVRGVNQWTMDEQSQTLTAGTNTYTAPAGTVDILTMTLKRDGDETEMLRISRSDWRLLVDKTTEGRPDRFFFDKSVTNRTIYLWPEPENSTDQIVYYRMARIEDAGAYGETTLDIPSEWLEAMAAGLAAKLALKHAVDRVAMLKPEARDQFRAARMASDDTADIRFWRRYQ